MLLFEAKHQIEERLNLKEELKQHAPEYFEALEIANKCIDAQIRLAGLLNGFTEDELNTDTYSALLTYEMLSSIRFDEVFDSEDMFDIEKTEQAAERKGQQDDE